MYILYKYTIQVDVELKDEMAETLRRYYGVNLEKQYNRDVTYAWDRIQERVIHICFCNRRC